MSYDNFDLEINPQKGLCSDFISLKPKIIAPQAENTKIPSITASVSQNQMFYRSIIVQFEILKEDTERQNGSSQFLKL